MEKLYDYLPQQLVTFILVTLFSLLIGLSQRRISLRREGETTLFGTDRTFTFIGILGYLLYILDPKEMHLFMGGGIILGMLLGINYYVKQSQFHVFGVTTIIIALITYCMAPIISTQPSWFYVMMVVTVLLFTEMKHTFTELVQRMQIDEIIKKIPPKLKKQINNVSNSYRIYYNQYDPIIYTKIKEDHIELQIRYLIHPKKARYVESIISSDILLAYKNGEIEIYK